MDFNTVKEVFEQHGLPAVATLKKLDVGFTNKVYSADNRYIIKVCGDPNNETPFRREVELYKYFHDKLPVPNPLVYDDSKSRVKSHYMIYPFIDGENLYNIWHTLTNVQRQDIVKQLCAMLKLVNETDTDKLPPAAVYRESDKWKQVVTNRIEKYLVIAERMRTLSPEFITQIRKFVISNAAVLDRQKLALVYWDVHFDNILVKEGEIIGLLDFERTEMASIDFVLDTVRRMVDFPKKYMSAAAEQYAKDEDYKDLLNWYQKFYPELFEFDHLGRRLDLYALAHDLIDLEGWPNVQALKDNIRKIVETV